MIINRASDWDPANEKTENEQTNEIEKQKDG